VNTFKKQSINHKQVELFSNVLEDHAIQSRGSVMQILKNKRLVAPNIIWLQLA